MASATAELSKKLRALLDFTSDQRGHVAIIFGCAAVPLLVLGGGVMDYYRATLTQKDIQAALDAAVLAGVTGSHNDDEQVAVATAYFEANRDANITLGDLSFHHNGDVLVGNATSNIPTAFLRLIHMPTLLVAAESSATALSYREPLCVMAMHPTRKHTLELKGSVDVIGPACNFYGNSTHPDDVVDPHTPDNYLTGKSVQANGYGHHYLENVTPPLEHAPEVLSDPLAGRTIPAAPSCSFNNMTVTNDTVTLTPDNYCGGLRIINSTVTLSPGLYFIEAGKFFVQGSTVTGTDVTIVFVDQQSSIDWQNSTIRLSAQTTGSEKGLVLMGQRGFDVSNSIDRSTVDLEGVVYLPQGEFDWTNTGTPTITAKWTAWVVDGFSWDGDGVINFNFDYENGVPYPDELKRVIPRPGVPRLLS